MTGQMEESGHRRLVEFAACVRNLDEDALFEMLGRSDEGLRTAAARELQARGTRSSFERATGLAHHDSPTLREMAAFVLGQLGTPRCPYATGTFPLLLGLLEDVDARVQSAAATAVGSLASLGHQPPRAIVARLTGMAADERADVRASVAFALALTRNRSAALIVKTMTHDRDERVREMAQLYWEMRESEARPRRSQRRRQVGGSRAKVASDAA